MTENSVGTTHDGSDSRSEMTTVGRNGVIRIWQMAEPVGTAQCR